MPWCIQKCPYCDFNSHKSPRPIPESAYIEALLEDLKHDLEYIEVRPIESIFIGGGTPSLFSADSYAYLFDQINKQLCFDNTVEITLEANPGTLESDCFKSYLSAGINRLSLGIQSFNPKHLQKLGRIHDHHQAHKAILKAQDAGITNINLDLMHGLPNQTLEEGIADLKEAIAYKPAHISWYQLTLEPNTVFYKQKPTLPNDDAIHQLEQQGFNMLHQAGYTRYEISAFCRNNQPAKHNLNYWLFGDYIGIGAGAHGKYTQNNQVVRTQKMRQPKDYLNPDKSYLVQKNTLTKAELIFEFMLNATRLEQAIPLSWFHERTGIALEQLLPKLEEAKSKKLITIDKTHWQVTPLGRNFTNDLQALFLP